MFVNPRIYYPPLENGDRLTRIEFEHRYQAIPDIKKNELRAGNLRDVLVVLRQGLQTEEHQGFVQRLNLHQETNR